jgi:hypothetical protein
MRSHDGPVALYRVLRCVDCDRPLVPDVGDNYFQSSTDRALVWFHRDHARAPEEVTLDGPDHEIGGTLRDSTGAQCVVTKIAGNQSWGIKVSDLARQSDA